MVGGHFAITELGFLGVKSRPPGGYSVTKNWLLRDLAYVLRENRMILRVWRIQQLILFGWIGCADHCVYIVLGTINAYLGGPVVVGSELAKNFFVMPQSYLILYC